MIIPAEESIKKVLPTVEVNKSAINSLYVGRPILSIDVSKQSAKIKKR